MVRFKDSLQGQLVLSYCIMTEKYFVIWQQVHDRPPNERGHAIQVKCTCAASCWSAQWCPWPTVPCGWRWRRQPSRSAWTQAGTGTQQMSWPSSSCPSSSSGGPSPSTTSGTCLGRPRVSSRSLPPFRSISEGWMTPSCTRSSGVDCWRRQNLKRMSSERHLQVETRSRPRRFRVICKRNQVIYEYDLDPDYRIVDAI